VTGICNVTCAESPLDNSGPDDYDLSPDGSKVAFITKDIHLPQANYTSSQVYVVPFEGSAEDAIPVNPRGSGRYKEAQGISSTPKFSPDSNKVAYTQMNGISYESDRTILYSADVSKSNSPKITRLAGDWDRSPGSPTWAKDGDTIFVVAEDRGRGRIFPIPLSAGDSYEPKNITDEGVPKAFHVLPKDKLLVTDTKIWSSCDIYSVSDKGKVDKVYFEANKVDKALKGLGPEDVSEFYFKTNSSESEMHSWLVFPEGFEKNKTYPLAFLTHGGPQGSWANSWSTRWNPK
jgi:dipeptidyl aminopeptidase/acylaminoacyl peptidase